LSIPARAHTAKLSIHFFALNETKKARHPPYLLNLTPSDVFLFGCVKRNLMGYSAEKLSELLVRIQGILRAIPGETLVEFFRVDEMIVTMY
jgi:hypothetical protein